MPRRVLTGALLARTAWPHASLPYASLPRTVLARS